MRYRALDILVANLLPLSEIYTATIYQRPSYLSTIKPLRASQPWIPCPYYPIVSSVIHNLSKAPLLNIYYRNNVKDKRYPYIPSPHSKDTGIRHLSTILAILDRYRYNSEGSLCLTTTQIFRPLSYFCRLNRTDKSLMQRVYTGISKSHTVDLSYLSNVSNNKPRKPYYKKIIRRDSRIKGIYAILVDRRVCCFYNAINRE